MTTFLIIVLVILMIMVVVSLVRGIVAFLAANRADIDAGSTRHKDLQLMQNKMMFSRIKFQAAAILVVALLLGLAR
ncbi:hypothetical protein [Tsuneonella sp. HG222]